MAQAVKVGIRVRPLNEKQLKMNSQVCVSTDENKISIIKSQDAKQFIFDYIFPQDAKQQSIYETCAFPIVENALDGFNGTIFAYGQTGAGKTFTMVGDPNSLQFKGLIPRAFDHLVSAISNFTDRQYMMQASFMEIYNQEIMDLLEDNAKNKKKALRQNPKRGVYVDNIKKVTVKSTEEMFKVLNFGNNSRTVSATAMNETSSRSHAIFELNIESIEFTQGKQSIKSAKINLVDLAGSERQSKTHASGDRLKEGAKINLSLSALGNVINALVDGAKGSHIPFRDSKLTRLLQNSLGGNSKTLMIASVSPAQFNYQETLNTIRYAARARNIKNTPKINQDPKDAIIKEYFEEIQRLKKMLSEGNYEGGSEEMGLIKQKSDEKQKALNEKEKQVEQMKLKLKEMQELLMKNGKSNPEAQKQRSLRKKAVLKREEIIKQRVMDLEEKEKHLFQEEKFDESKPPQDIIACYKKLSKELRNRLKATIQDKNDIQKEFEQERQSLNQTIRGLECELSFYKQVSEKFMEKLDLNMLRQASTLDQEKRQYSLVPFLMHQERVTLPKSLKSHQVEDLWNESRKKKRFELVSDQIQKTPEISTQTKTFYRQEPSMQSSFLKNRSLLSDMNYNHPRYQQKEYKEYQLAQQRDMFLRTDYRIASNSKSKSRSASGKKKLSPLRLPKQTARK